jgi:hypothetical protein
MTESQELRCRLRVKWHQTGSAILDVGSKIQFPKLPSDPGLYRLRISRLDESNALYAGETDNLQRRFAQYRNPGPTQGTNIRLNALCVQTLAAGGVVSLAIATEAWLAWDSSPEVRADFRRKSVRRLFENLVVSADKAVEVEDLNR